LTNKGEWSYRMINWDTFVQSLAGDDFYRLVQAVKIESEARLEELGGLTEDEQKMSKIAAIKSIRNRLGLGLFESKSLYEQWLSRRGKQPPA
jgi:hypothetical protein